MKRWIQKADDKLLAYFERPTPRKAAKKALWLVTHIEQLFFLPFKLFTMPALWILEARYRKRGKHGNS